MASRDFGLLRTSCSVIGAGRSAVSGKVLIADNPAGSVGVAKNIQTAFAVPVLQVRCRGSSIAALKTTPREFLLGRGATTIAPMVLINMNNLMKLKNYAWNSRARMGRLRALASARRGGICAEIGVWKGDFSRRILQLCRPRELHLVDPWRFAPQFPHRWYGGALARDQAAMDAIFTSVVERFRQNRLVSIHRDCSAQAVKNFHDHYFDWIYIDGDHSFESVLNDLKSWSSKVRPDGVIVLDDYDWRDENNQLSVKLAIEAFLANNRVKTAKCMQGQFLIRTP